MSVWNKNVKRVHAKSNLRWLRPKQRPWPRLARPRPLLTDLKARPRPQGEGLTSMQFWCTKACRSRRNIAGQWIRLFWNVEIHSERRKSWHRKIAKMQNRQNVIFGLIRFFYGILFDKSGDISVAKCAVTLSLKTVSYIETVLRYLRQGCCLGHHRLIKKSDNVNHLHCLILKRL